MKNVLIVGLLLMLVTLEAGHGEQFRNSPFAEFRPEPIWTDAQKAAGYATWAGDPAVPFYGKQPPSTGELARAITFATCAGEYEPAVLGVWRLTEGAEFTLRVAKSPFPIEIRHVEFLERNIENKTNGKKRQLNMPFWLLKDPAAAAAAAGRNEVFWLTLHTPADAQPGAYDGTLALTVSGPAADQGAVVDVPFTIKVLPFRLPRADAAFGMYYDPYAHYSPAYKTEEMLRKQCEDMAAHGHTSVALVQNGKDRDPDTGELLPNTLGAQALVRMTEAGLVHPDVPVMYLASQNLPQIDFEHCRRYGRNLKERSKAQGWPEIVYYGPDEPGNHADHDYSPELEALQQIRSELRTGTACYGWFMEKYGEYLDVWVLHHTSVVTEVLALAQKLGAEAWTYNCGSRGINIPYHRFYTGLFTWVTGVRGNFLWVYGGPELSGNHDGGYAYVMHSEDGPVPSVGWEARREGIKDYRYLQLLQQLLMEKAGTAAATEARAWLGQLRKRLDTVFVSQNAKTPGNPWQTIHLPVFINPEVKGLGPWDLNDFEYPDIDIKPSDYTGLRRECIEHILRLWGE